MSTYHPNIDGPAEPYGLSIDANGNPLPPGLRFTSPDSERAEKEWKATCGPHSIAAALGKTLDEVRPALSNYKGWMSPTQMIDTLHRCTACEPAKWIPEWEWRHFHVNCEPKSPFHITHHYILPPPR